MSRTKLEYRDLVSNNPFKLVSNYNIQAIEDKLASKDVYFDTSEVIDMIMGIQVFNEGLEVDRRRLFKRKSTLVHTLAYKGWLKKISLLPFHQDELHHKILNDRSNRFPRQEPESEDLIAELLYIAGITDIEIALKGKTKKQIKDYINNLENINTPMLFKAAELIKDTFWYDRYKRLFDGKDALIEINEEPYDVGILSSKPVFKPILECLNKVRPGKTTNNLSDALALTTLQDKLDLYKKNNKQYALPIYYANSYKVYIALKKYIQNNEQGHFYYEREQGQQKIKVPIIRDSEFFILDAVFNATDGGDEPFNDGLGVEDGIKLDKNIQLLENAYEQKEQDEKQKEQKPNENFAINAAQIVNLDFFLKTWYDNDGLEAVSKILYQHYNEKADELKENIEKEIEERKRKLGRTFSKSIGISRKIFKDIPQFKKITEKKIGNFAEEDIFREFALTQFSFNENICTKIQDCASALIEASNNDDRVQYNHVILRTIQPLTNGIEAKKDGTKNKIEQKKIYDEFTTALAILWTFEKYKLVSELCEEVSDKDKKGMPVNYPNYQIPIIHGSALIQNGKIGHKLFKIIDGLENALTKSNLKNYKICIGVAHIAFNAWYAKMGSPRLPELMHPNRAKRYFKTDIYKKYYLKAIDHVDKAIEVLYEIKDTDDEKSYRQTKYYYALNNYIYYVTKGGTPELFNQLEPKCDELEDAEQQKIHWQSRFHDTLAWYYFRKAIIFKDAGEYERFKFYLKEAKSRYNLFIPANSKEEAIKKRLKKLVDKEMLEIKD